MVEVSIYRQCFTIVLIVSHFLQVFPKGSPYLPDISEAIVKIAEKGKLKELQDSLTSSYKCSASEDSNENHERLEFSSFMGLFVIAWIIPAIALFLFYISPYIRQHQPPQQLDLQQRQQHDFRVDEDVLFAAEMENQRGIQYLYYFHPVLCSG